MLVQYKFKVHSHVGYVSRKFHYNEDVPKIDILFLPETRLFLPEIVDLQLQLV